MMDHRYEAMNRLTNDKTRFMKAEVMRKKKFSLTVAMRAMRVMRKTAQ